MKLLFDSTEFYCAVLLLYFIIDFVFFLNALVVIRKQQERYKNVITESLQDPVIKFLIAKP